MAHLPAPLVAATQAHADAMAAIHAAAVPPPDRWGADAMSLQLGLPGAFGWIDPAGGFVLARVAADEAEILSLAVAPASRRAGVARRMLAAAMRHAHAKGAAAMLLEVAASNVAARALYSQAGFQEVGRRPRYYANAEDALIMRADLASCG